MYRTAEKIAADSVFLIIVNGAASSYMSQSYNFANFHGDFMEKGKNCEMSFVYFRYITENKYGSKCALRTETPDSH